MWMQRWKLASMPFSWRIAGPSSWRELYAVLGNGVMTSEYSKGLHDLGDGCFAYLQPDGGWGWSNAGLVVGDGVSLLVDTLFDGQGLLADDFRNL